jgi:hypothetical protein
MVSTLDFESNNPSSNLGKTLFLLFSYFKEYYKNDYFIIRQQNNYLDVVGFEIIFYLILI